MNYSHFCSSNIDFMLTDNIKSDVVQAYLFINQIYVASLLMSLKSKTGFQVELKTESHFLLKYQAILDINTPRA